MTTLLPALSCIILLALGIVCSAKSGDGVPIIIAVVVACIVATQIGMRSNHCKG
jgi:hypothetical protein